MIEVHNNNTHTHTKEKFRFEYILNVELPKVSAISQFRIPKEKRAINSREENGMTRF